MIGRVVCAALLAFVSAFGQATSIPAAAAGGGSAAFTPAQNGGTDVICAKGSDTISGITCNNSSDATSETAFASSVTIAAGTLSNTTVTHNIVFGVAAATSLSVTLRIRLGGTLIYQGATAATGSGTSAAGVSVFTCMTTAAGSAGAVTPIITSCTTGGYAGSTPRNTLLSATALSVTANTAVSQVLTVSAQYSANTAGNAIWLYAISPGGGPGATGPAGPTGPTGPAGNGTLFHQSQQTGTSMTGADVVIGGATYSVPGGTMGAGGCLYGQVLWQETGGVATTVKLWFGATAYTIASGVTRTTIFQQTYEVCNNNGSTTAQQITAPYDVYGIGASSVPGLYTDVSGSMVTAAETTTGAVVIKVTANAASGTVALIGFTVHQ